MTLAIEASDLTKTYPPDVRALDGLSLAVRSGTIFGLLGPNGAGKSTTVRILTTLSRPDAARRASPGSTSSPSRVRVRHAIGVVGQKHGLDPEATGRENLVLQGELYGITGRDLRRRVGRRSSASGSPMPPTVRPRPTRAACSAVSTSPWACIHRPQVLFLDEPTTGLDPEARTDMWHEIERLAREEQMTILLTTHYLEEADRLASQLAIVDRGRIVAEGTPDELKSELEGDTIHDRARRWRRRGPRGARRRRRDRRASLEGGRCAPGRATAAPRSRPSWPRSRPATSRGLGHDGPPVARRRLPAPRRARLRPRGGGGMTTALRQTWQVSLRHLRVFVRQPAFLGITLTQPIIWLLLFGALFKAVTQIPGFDDSSYIDFLTPGIVVMLAVSSAGWTGMAFIEDINGGVMDRVLASPVWRGALNLGSVVYAMVAIVVQTLVIVLLAWRSARTSAAASAACSF